MREWIRSRLTLRRVTTTTTTSTPLTTIGKSRRQRPPPTSAKWKLSVDRTLVKQVRRLPPHGTLMILHAVRVPGVLHDHDDSYGMGSRRKPKGHRARNGRNAGIMIVGHNPTTGARMSMVPDQSVLEYATQGDTHASLKYLTKGGDRHFHMRRCAEQVIAQLVLMDRNGTPTLSHIKMRWVREALERAAAAAALEGKHRGVVVCALVVQMVVQWLCKWLCMTLCMIA